MNSRVTHPVRIERGDPSYPMKADATLGADAPSCISAFGNLDLLDLPLTALFSSILTPPDLVLRSFDLALTLRRERLPVIGGFQSPLERECRTLLLRGSQPLVMVLPRDIERMRIPAAWRAPLREERLLILSPFVKRRRPVVRAALTRNRLVAALADRVMVIHARAGSRAYRTAAGCIEWGKEVYCFEHRRNLDLILLGARPADAQTLIRPGP